MLLRAVDDIRQERSVFAPFCILLEKFDRLREALKIFDEALGQFVFIFLCIERTCFLREFLTGLFYRKFEVSYLLFATFFISYELLECMVGFLLIEFVLLQLLLQFFEFLAF